MSLIKILFFIYYGTLVLLIQISAHISRESTIKKKKPTSHCINNPTIHVAFPLVHIKKKKKKNTRGDPSSPSESQFQPFSSPHFAPARNHHRQSQFLNHREHASTIVAASSSALATMSKLKPTTVEMFLHLGHRSHIVTSSLKAPITCTNYTPALLATTFSYQHRQQLFQLLE